MLASLAVCCLANKITPVSCNRTCTSARTKKEKARCKTVPYWKKWRLFLVFFIGSFLALRFGFFHGLLGFCGALGAGFDTLLTLFFLHFLAAKQFNECRFRAIAFAPSGADDAHVST